MAEEIKPVEGEQKPVLNEVEVRASEQGWVPKEEWSGEPDAWRPAKEFLDRGELFKKIDDQNKVIKDMRRTMEEFSKHHARVAQAEYKRALDDLRNQKRAALEVGDADALLEIDEKMAEVREESRQQVNPVTVPTAPEPHPLFVAWVQKNGWYETNKAMRAYADKVGVELGQAGGLSTSEILSEVEKHVKKEFAHKFENPRRAAPAAVEGSGARGTTSKDSFQLSDHERQVMQKFVKLGAITEEKYIEELKAAKARGV
jgi:hypothetical protein